MATSTRDLTLRFVADTDQLRSASSQVRKTTSGMSNDIGSAGEKGSKRFGKGIGAMGAAIGKFAGPLAALFAADKIKDFGVDAVNQASDLNETMSKSQAIFGKQAGSMNKWSKNAATAFGLSQSEALAAAAGFGDMFQQIGFTGKEATKSSKNVVQMAADLGSFNNLETGDVLDRISAAMRGEYDSLQAVIPNINAARVEKEALAKTGKKNADALTAEEKAQATLAIIQKDGSRAMGDFAKTSGGFANQQKIMKANFDNLKATLGQAFLPLLSKGAKLLNDVLGPAAEVAGTGITKITDAIQGTWDLLVNHDFTSAFAQAFGVEEDAPIVAFLIDLNEAFTGTGDKASGMAKAFDSVRAGFTAVAEAGKKLWAVIGPIFQQIGGKIFAQIKKNMPEIKAMFAELVSAVGTFFQIVGAYYTKIAGVLKKVWSVIGPTVLAVLGNVIDAIVGILSGAIKVISGILDIIIGLFTGDFGRVKKGVQKILLGLVKIIKSILLLGYRNMKAVIEPLVKWVIGKILGLKRKITGIFQSITNWIKSTWSKAWAKIESIFVAPVVKAYRLIKYRLAIIQQRFKAIKDYVLGKFAQSWSKAKETFTKPITNARVSIGKAIDKIRSKLTGVKDWLKGTWAAGWAKAEEWIMKPIRAARDAFTSIFGKGGKLRTTLSGFITAAGTIFGKMKAAIGKPINAVISFINKGFIRGGINKILGALGVPKKDQVPWLSPVAYEAGGPVSGGSPWQRAGRDRYPAYLDRDEHVWTRDEVRKAGGHRRLYAWRKAVRQGKAYDYPALAGGGVVRPVPGGFGTFPSYPGHTGVDFPVGTGTPVHAVTAGVIKAVRSLTTSYGRHIIQSLPNGMEAIYAHLNSFATRVGANVGAGQVIGYSDSTGNSTGPHLHFTLQHPGGNYIDPTSFLQSGKLPGGTAGGGVTGAISDMVGFLKGLSPVKWLTDKAAALKEGIYKLIGRFPLAEGLARLPGMLMRKAGSFMQEKLFGGIMSSVGEPAGSGVARWRSTIVAALKANGLPTSDDYVNAWLRQVESESGGNPKAVQNGYVDVNTISGDLAKGLLQTISATFNAYKHAGHGDIFNGFDNALAAINYAKSRYGAQGMLGVIGHGHGYDNGGWLKRGATLAINNTNRPEAVLTGRQWDALAAGGTPTVINIRVDGTVNDDRTIGKLLTEIDRYQRRRGPVQLARRT